MNRRYLVSVLVMLCMSLPALAGEYKFCLLINRVADGGILNEYTDNQVSNGLCMASKELLNGMTSGDSYKESICLKASEHMMMEFKRRFPRRDPKSVIGRC